MPDESTPIVAPSEQGAAPVATPSEQGKAAEATQPVAETKAPEPEPKVDLDAIRKEAVEKVRHDLESTYGKRLSEAQKQERERARQEREQLLARLSDFVPDEQLNKTREEFTKAEQFAAKEARLAQLESYAAQKAREEQYAQLASEAQALAAEAGYKIEELPKDVLGTTPEGFEKRLAAHVVKENTRLKKEMESAVKKAAEDAVRETERKLGVTKVAGSEPVGTGKSRLGELTERLRSAHLRGDEAAIREIGNLIEEEAYRRK